MKRGLVIGKFLPLHRGHIELIRFAMTQCDELIVSMSYTLSDPIDPKLRFSWISETFEDQPTIKPEMVLDDFDDLALPWPERVKVWANFIRKRFPKIDLVFSSEEYGDALGQALGIPHVAFDMSRKKVPVSATAIREKPFLHWVYIPDVVRPYFVTKVCFYGPESTGKSILAKHLAGLYETEYVPEVAREMITSNDFSIEDIIRIGKAQTERILQKTKTANKILFCDTDLITTQIYSRIYLNEVPAILYELEKAVRYDQYFLFDIDSPWLNDGLRDLGDRREEIYLLFKKELEKRDITYVNVFGDWTQREKIVADHLSKLV